MQLPSNALELQILVSNYKKAKYEDSIQDMEFYFRRAYVLSLIQMHREKVSVSVPINILFDWLEGAIVKRCFDSCSSIIDKLIFYYRFHDFIDNQKANLYSVPYFYDLMGMVGEYYESCADPKGYENWLNKQEKWVDNFARSEIGQLKKNSDLLREFA